MGIRAILQRGRGHPLLTLPADAVNRINDQKARTPGPKDAPPVVNVKEDPISGPKVEPTVEPEPLAEPVVAVVEPELLPEPEPTVELIAELPPGPKGQVSGLTAKATIVRGPGRQEPAVSLDGPREPESIPLFDDDEEDEVTRGDDFMALQGIGRATASRLKAAGYEKFEDLAEADAGKLRRLLGAKTDEVILAAKEALK